VENTPANPPRIADYFRPIWQRKWLVLAIVVLATGATYARSVRQSKVYSTGTLVYYQPGGDPLNGGTNFTSDRTIQDVAGLLYAQNVAVDVAKRIHFPGRPGALVAAVTISARLGQDFVAISASWGSPQLAATIANGYAQQLVAITNNDQQVLIKKELQSVKQQLARTGNAATDLPSRQAFSAQVAKLQLALAVPTGTRQVSPAFAPALPSSPHPVKDAIFAFVLSLALAVACAFGLERFDRRLRLPEDLAGAYGLPLLAALPHSQDPAPRQDGAVGIDSGFHDAFGLLRTNIHLLSLDAPPRTVVVVSAVPSEGKSTVVRNLAIVLAEAGKRVVVVEADLRRPMQSGLFGLPAGPGLTEVLTGTAALEDVLYAVPVRARGLETLTRISAADPHEISTNGHAGDPAQCTISVLLAGTHPPNPATVLESARVVEVLDQLSATHDMLLLDSAPLLSVTDSVPLVRYADAAVVVGRLGLTTRDSARRMTDFLRRMPEAQVLGVVANDVTERGPGYGYDGGYGYGYGAGGGAFADDVPPKSKRARRAKSAEQV